MIYNILQLKVFKYLMLPFVLICSFLFLVRAISPFPVLEKETFGLFNEEKIPTTFPSVEMDICSEEGDAGDIFGTIFGQNREEESLEGIWISPEDTTLLFPEFGFCKNDLFVQNKDTLSGYYIHPDLISSLETVLNICKDYEKISGKSPQIRINSVVRSVPYNRRIGGVKNSEHLEPLGHAIDIRFAFGDTNKRYIRYFAHIVNTRNSSFDKLLSSGARSFGFYPWGVHFGVRERTNPRRFHNQVGYAVWDKRGKK